MTNLPQPQHQPDDNVWARFSVNPHTHPEVRASDTDRDVAAEVINAAFSDGRLDNLEHADRLSAVLGAKTLGELVPLLSDVTIAARPAVPKTPVAAARDTAAVMANSSSATSTRRKRKPCLNCSLARCTIMPWKTWRASLREVRSMNRTCVASSPNSA